MHQKQAPDSFISWWESMYDLLSFGYLLFNSFLIIHQRCAQRHAQKWQWRRMYMNSPICSDLFHSGFIFPQKETKFEYYIMYRKSKSRTQGTLSIKIFSKFKTILQILLLTTVKYFPAMSKIYSYALHHNFCWTKQQSLYWGFTKLTF